MIQAHLVEKDTRAEDAEAAAKRSDTEVKRLEAENDKLRAAMRSV
jgi:hypothetical protein